MLPAWRLPIVGLEPSCTFFLQSAINKWRNREDPCVAVGVGNKDECATATALHIHLAPEPRPGGQSVGITPLALRRSRNECATPSRVPHRGRPASSLPAWYPAPGVCGVRAHASVGAPEDPSRRSLRGQVPALIVPARGPLVRRWPAQSRAVTRVRSSLTAARVPDGTALARVRSSPPACDGGHNDVDCPRSREILGRRPWGSRRRGTTPARAGPPADARHGAGRTGRPRSRRLPRPRPRCCSGGYWRPWRVGAARAGAPGRSRRPG